MRTKTIYHNCKNAAPSFVSRSIFSAQGKILNSTKRSSSNWPFPNWHSFVSLCSTTIRSITISSDNLRYRSIAFNQVHRFATSSDDDNDVLLPLSSQAIDTCISTPSVVSSSTTLISSFTLSSTVNHWRQRFVFSSTFLFTAESFCLSASRNQIDH